MTAGAALWETFVAVTGRDAAMLAEIEPKADAKRLAALGHVAFRIGLSCLGIGAEPVGRLALAIEKALDQAPSTCSHRSSSAARVASAGSGSMAPVLVVPAVATIINGRRPWARSSAMARRSARTFMRSSLSHATARHALRPRPAT